MPTYTETTSSTVYVSSTANYGKGYSVCLAHSTENKSITTYTNWNFDGGCVFKDKALFFSRQGLFSYGGNKDNGFDIRTSIKTEKMNQIQGQGGLVRTQQLKHIPTCSVYLGVDKEGGSLDLNVTADSATYNYNTEIEHTGFAVNKIKVGRGLRFNFVQLEIKSNGCESLDVESIEFEVKPLKSGRREGR